MTRQEILSSPEYWIAKAQIDLYNCAEDFMRANNINRVQLAKHLGVSKGYVSQLLNGDYDHKLSKFVELSIAFGFVPKIEFQSIDEAINKDRFEYISPKWRPVTYNVVQNALTAQFSGNEIYEHTPVKSNTNAA